ncbi:MAG: enoyl-CoA hydratase family protein [Acidimicrobiales bacterium]
MSPFRASAPTTGEWKHFRFEVDDGVATLTLNRPERLNALTFEAYADLRDLLAELPGRGDVRALVLTGEGRGFCSGGDVDAIIGELIRMGAKELLEFTRMTGAVVQALRECPSPVVAAVNGTAAGAGAVIALAADLRVVSRQATFRFLFTQVGLSGGDMGAAYLLPRVIGLGRATESLLFGEPIGAEAAERIGLANWVVDPDRVLDEATALARRLADGPSLAYAATKALLTREQDMSLAAAIELEAVTQAHLMKTDDFAEFHAAFTERRPPEWRGR